MTGQEQDRTPVTVTNWDSSTGRMEFTVDERTAAMIRAGVVSGLSIRDDGAAQPVISRVHPGQREDREFMAAIEADAVKRLPAAMDALRARLMALPLPEPIRVNMDAPPPPPPAVDPMDVTWPDQTFKVFPDRTERTINHPDGIGWTDQLDVMVASPSGEPDASLTALYAWAAQRAAEQMMLDDMAAILKARPADAPGVLLLHYPEATTMMESQWIPSGTLIFSALDQPDLMVKVDPDGDGVLYYRQTPALR